MPTFRVHKTKNFTVMSNRHFLERDMSLKAKGLLSLMLSLPEDWDYSIAGLASLSSDGETSVRTALQELEQFRYLRRRKVYENGRIKDWEYDIFEEPMPENEAENLDVENQILENQVVENKDNKIRNKQYTKSKKRTKEINNTNQAHLVKPKSRYEKLRELVCDFTSNAELRDALMNFVNLQMEMSRETGKGYFENMLKGSLDKLRKEFREKDWLEVVQNATRNGWRSFYPAKQNGGKKSIKDEPNERGLSCEPATAEVLEHNYQMALKREAEGKRGFF